MKTNSQGSILSGVLMSTLFVAIISASVLSLINTQRRVNLQREVQLQANAAAETALDYAYSYIINDIQQNTLANAGTIPSTGYRTFTFPTAVEDFLLGTITLQSGLQAKPGVTTLTGLEVRVLAPRNKKRYRVDGKDPANATDPNKDQWVNESLVPIVARITARHGTQEYTAYVHKGISSREIALFQYSIFFQGQLHLHRGFRPMGGVHANGNLFLNAHNGDGAIYNGAVTTAANFYRGSTFDSGGTGADSFGYTPVNAAGQLDFTIAGVNPVATGGSGDLKIYTESPGNVHTYVPLTNTLDSRLVSWKDDATALFKGHLEDKAHLVPELTPVGSEGYRQDVKATTGVNEFNNSPYALIEPNLPVSHASHKATLENSLQAKASLIFIIEHNDLTPAANLRTTDGVPPSATSSIAGVGSGNPLTAKNDYLIDPDDDNVIGGNEPRISNPWKTFIVRAYKVSATWDRSLGTDIHGLDSGGNPYLIAVPLPTGVIGAANASVTSIASDGVFEDFDVTLTAASASAYTGAGVDQIKLIPSISSVAANRTLINHNDQRVRVDKGLFDSRMGRAVVPLTIDIAKLKYVLEAPIGLLSGADLDFRNQFNPAQNIGTVTAPRTLWNGLVYVEFPTSLNLQNAAAILPTNILPVTGAGNTGKSRRFDYGVKEKRHPDRWFITDHASRGDRADSIVTATNPKPGIVPIAPELRDYPDSNHVTQRPYGLLPPTSTLPVVNILAADYGKTSTILNERYAIPALQIINGRELPHPNTGNDEEGFTIATNGPVYLVGNYNSDGNYLTGTSITNSAPDAYSEKDTAITEIPAAIFCDTFTILSNGWGWSDATVTLSNRNRSFYGANNSSTVANAEPGRVGGPPGRPIRIRPLFSHPTARKNDGTVVTHPATSKYVEISACVATGEFPIFEFFTHCLENWAGSGAPTPIIIKGSMVGMFHSELQHIKQAYGRSTGSDIQAYWQEHGANAFVSSRYHRMLYEGNFPPGTPMAYVTSPREFRLLRQGDVTDNTVISDSGF
ncbi:hypothetical protein CMV30_01440 [Nibricoccus aquaticus]|uniref:DUF4900 domain-containing protein n=1 Tax=Nibricoccus aquaticus TaxID=2576891 RepID=A0A290Q256_9BACT|nr:hypothetical protein [Nibricoccus aquaticus]ATC62735.1 hypothetical protein CMV30_01440 [Nibricoccus aquaticus]